MSNLVSNLILRAKVQSSTVNTDYIDPTPSPRANCGPKKPISESSHVRRFASRFLIDSIDSTPKRLLVFCTLRLATSSLRNGNSRILLCAPACDTVIVKKRAISSCERSALLLGSLARHQCQKWIRRKPTIPQTQRRGLCLHRYQHQRRHQPSFAIFSASQSRSI